MNRQFRLNPISRAVIVAIGAAATAGTASAQGVIEEIVVTATKRAEVAQDIAITVNTIGEDELRELNITNFADTVPAVVAAPIATITARRIGFKRNCVFIFCSPDRYIFMLLKNIK